MSVDLEAARKSVNISAPSNTSPNVHDNPAFEKDEDVKNDTEIRQTNEELKDGKETSNTPKADKQSENPSGSVNSAKSVDSGVDLTPVEILSH